MVWYEEQVFLNFKVLQSMKKMIYLPLALVMLIATLRTGEAVSITDITNDFAINWLLPQGGQDHDGGAGAPIDLSARAVFDVVDVQTDTNGFISAITLDVSFSNTTLLSGAITKAGITTFGIGINPDATGVTFSDTSDGGFTTAEIQDKKKNFPGGFKQIDLCVFTQGCSGGGQGGALAAGATDDFSLTVTFGTPTASSIIFDPFPVKFQTSNESFKFGGSASEPVPEPGTLTLMGSGLLGLVGYVRKRRRQTT